MPKTDRTAERCPREKATAEARRGKGETFGGVEVEGRNCLPVPGSSGSGAYRGMNKRDLGKAIRKKQ